MPSYIRRDSRFPGDVNAEGCTEQAHHLAGGPGDRPGSARMCSVGVVVESRRTKSQERSTDHETSEGPDKDL